MKGIWRKLRGLDTVDRQLLVQATGLMIAVSVGLRVLPFTKVRKRRRDWINREVRNSGAFADGRADRTIWTAEATRIVWAVRAAGSRMPGRTCLVEALTADAMLRRHGYAPALKIGVRRGSLVSLDAHAWVECEGTVVIGETATLAEYVVLS